MGIKEFISVKFLINLLFIGLSFTAQAQSLFYDHMKGSDWWTEAAFDDSITFAQKEIGLANISRTDSMPSTFDVWMFNDMLHIYRYDSIAKALSTVRRLPYEIVEEKAKTYIRIYPFYTQEYIDYEVGIVSDGKYILLIKRKKKK